MTTPWRQKPDPGSRHVCCAGDAFTITLTTSSNSPQGKAWLRTNIGQHSRRHREIIGNAENHEPILSGDWHDLPMIPHDDGQTFSIKLALGNPGCFEAKAFFLPNGATDPEWPEGVNLQIKVEPADTYAANAIYTAFVRQFGPGLAGKPRPPIPTDFIKALDDNEWTLIPKSGTFRQLAQHFDHIIDTLGFRLIQLLPIHPVPTTFARMGRFGSPFASIDFFDVDPALAEFDRTSTPLQQFGELVDAVHQRHARLMIDLPINHTGWASHLQLHHPEWFARDEHNAFASPGAWGVTWADLAELDYQHRDLWNYMADVFLFWCQKGVDGFRCDAGYMIPFPVWEYIIAKVRESYPDTLFLLEGLGGRISVTQHLLEKAGMNWAYSEIFQVFDRPGLEHQIQHDHHSATHHGLLVHFAETHDNNRLAATSPTHARMRTLLAALTADNGAFGITNGVEWFADAKVDVHGAPPLNWNASDNQLDTLAAINQLLVQHPAFHHGAHIDILKGSDAVLTIKRTPSNAPNDALLILINLDTQTPHEASWPLSDHPFDNTSQTTDLITQATVPLALHHNRYHCTLAPGQALCLGSPTPTAIPTPLARQRRKALLMRLHTHLCGSSLPPSLDIAQQLDNLQTDPLKTIARLAGKPASAILTHWHWPQDIHRIVPLPDHHLLLVESPQPFRIRIGNTNDSITENSVPLADTPSSSHLALLFFDPERFPSGKLNLYMTTYKPAQTLHQEAAIFLLPPAPGECPAMTIPRETLRNSNRFGLLTNSTGAMCQPRLEWATLQSKYDALLAANLHPNVPVDRHIMLTRCRAWLRHKGYSHEISLDCTRQVTVIPGEAIIWHFDAPAGLGRTVPLQFTLQILEHQNRITLAIERLPATSDTTHLPDDAPINVIIRPDIEDRVNHQVTKAYTGPEHHWPRSVQPHEQGFRFSTAPHATLHMQLEQATFTPEPEWTYAVAYPFEQQRGLDPSGDLFSPGYFDLPLQGGESSQLTAAVTTGTPSMTTQKDCPPPHPHTGYTLEEILKIAIKDFVVKRDQSHTVIAGYPWFLDWGRDTLICLRGMIAAGMIDQASDIACQFARFEKQGTIPNMIRGNDDRDRDTSDAPLWLFTACRDILDAGRSDFLDTPCGSRSLFEILKSIARHYINGTPNGIKMDPASGLIFSPSHFTWMDTNYPAGTPREGYPIEIQALWFAALQLLANTDTDEPQRWVQLANQVRQSIETHYRLPETQSLSDCLHAPPGTPASQATADNALRPNQLFAITLGAITDPELISGIITQTSKLLIPGAIRSLADQPVTPPLPIRGPHGLLNNPDHPYQGYYRGDEDTRRKPAYHNGTAWGWPFPSYCEALLMLDRDALMPTARSLMAGITTLLEDGCTGHLPEILDANAPHHQRGCLAQAWSATEAYRILTLLPA